MVILSIFLMACNSVETEYIQVQTEIPSINSNSNSGKVNISFDGRGPNETINDTQEIINESIN